MKQVSFGRLNLFSFFFYSPFSFIPSPLSDVEQCSKRVVGFEVRTRSVDTSRYSGDVADPNNLKCKIKATEGEDGSLVIDSSSSDFQKKKKKKKKKGQEKIKK